LVAEGRENANHRGQADDLRARLEVLEEEAFSHFHMPDSALPWYQPKFL